MEIIMAVIPWKHSKKIKKETKELEQVALKKWFDSDKPTKKPKGTNKSKTVVTDKLTGTTQTFTKERTKKG
jgi:DNA phosphorothioation-dependent restriction protein DptG